MSSARSRGRRAGRGLRVRGSSAGHEPERLVAGEDLVLELAEADALDVAPGVWVHDELGLEDRRRVDEAALSALADWRAAVDEALTVDGICLPWIWDWRLLLGVFAPIVRQAIGLDHAVARLRPDVVHVPADEPATVALVEAIVRRRGGEVVLEPPGPDAHEPEAAPSRRRRGRRAAALLQTVGLPSLPRSGGTLVLGYWTLMPVFDGMLRDPELRPTVAMFERPSGPGRTLRAAPRGGWVGQPGPRARRRAAAQARPALARATRMTPELDVDGLSLGAPLHAAAMEFARAHAAADLALAAVLRSAYRRGRIERVIAGADLERASRLTLSLAREAGVATMLVAHGASLVPQNVHGMELADEVAFWTPEIAYPVRDRNRPLHYVGYPHPHTIAPPRGPVRPEPPTVLVIALDDEPSTALLDVRAVARHLETALRAVADALPRARVVLRPHPSDDPRLAEHLGARFGELVDVTVDQGSGILDLLASADVCVAACSTASLQAGLTATPTVVLNVTEWDWPWPLGGATRVPVARDAPDLASWLARWRDGRELPGRDDLVRALGADGVGGHERLLDLLREAPAPLADRAQAAPAL